MNNQITFKNFSGRIEMQYGSERETVIALPRGITCQTHIDAARAFIVRTHSKLNAASQDEMLAIIEQAKATLRAIDNAASFLQPVPEMPW